MLESKFNVGSNVTYVNASKFIRRVKVGMLFDWQNSRDFISNVFLSHRSVSRIQSKYSARKWQKKHQPRLDRVASSSRKFSRQIKINPDQSRWRNLPEFLFLATPNYLYRLLSRANCQSRAVLATPQCITSFPTSRIITLSSLSLPSTAVIFALVSLAIEVISYSA